MNDSVESDNTSYRSVFKFEVENIALPEVYTWMNNIRLLYQFLRKIKPGNFNAEGSQIFRGLPRPTSKIPYRFIARHFLQETMQKAHTA